SNNVLNNKFISRFKGKIESLFDLTHLQENLINSYHFLEIKETSNILKYLIDNNIDIFSHISTPLIYIYDLVRPGLGLKEDKFDVRLEPYVLEKHINCFEIDIKDEEIHKIIFGYNYQQFINLFNIFPNIKNNRGVVLDFLSIASENECFDEAMD
ncbi:hypothetical protein, partial [Mesomycoplasma ovipneumoniae]|uniref:hypothetical protein n=1 Tax=Mesomycoplasma ovipneumoniae TaxID=29562 RepID=UPI0030807A53